MITMTNLFSKVDHTHKEAQHFFATDEGLQYKYNNLCEECTRLATEMQELEKEIFTAPAEEKEALQKAFLTKKEYLEVTQAKLDAFCKHHDIKF